MSYHEGMAPFRTCHNTLIRTFETEFSERRYREYVIQGSLHLEDVELLQMVSHRTHVGAGMIIPADLGLVEASERHCWEFLDDIVPTDRAATVLLNNVEFAERLDEVNRVCWSRSEPLDDVELDAEDEADFGFGR